jgi:outer membrane protein W
MKFKAAILAVGLVAMTACGASAGSNGTFCIGPTAGMSLPTGNYGDAATTGWHGGAMCNYNMNSGWGIGATIAYHSWGGSDQLNAAAAAAFGAGSKIDWSAIQLTPEASYHFRTSSSVKPYAMAGLGLYDLKSKLTTPTGNTDVSKSKVGFNFGGGMDFASHGTTTWGIDTAYHVISAQNDFGTNVNNLTVGLHMQFAMGGH